MDIAQLRTLIHVAELGSVTAAAGRLGIAQPALSRQIRLFEEELGGKIFTRHGRGMVLTSLGEEVIGPAGDILARLEDIRRCGSTSPKTLSGKVRVGVTPTVAEIATLPLVHAIKQAHPNLALCFTSGFSGHLIDWLKRGELDCCVAYEVPKDILVRTDPVLDETLLLVMARNDDPGLATAVPFSELQGRPLVLPSPAHGLRRILDTVALSTGITLTPTVEADSLNAMIDLVRGGFGATILPYAAIYSHVQSKELTASRLIDPTPSRRVVMTYPTDRAISSAARFVGQAFKTVAAQLVESGAWSGRIVEGISL